jgi:hypothetical protein
MRRVIGRSVILGLILAIAAAPAALAKEEPPDVTADGLHRVEGSKLALVYKKPGATLAGYKKLKILDCFVAFKKRWEIEQRSRGVAVSARDMKRIKKHVAEEFRKTFIEQLQSKGGYEVVDEEAEDVLLLRPAIIDLDVEAPDTMAAGRSDTFAASAGQMTLVLELYDSATSDLIARVIDRQAGRSALRIQWQTSVTNRAEAEQIFRLWANVLRERLDEAHGKSEK